MGGTPFTLSGPAGTFSGLAGSLLPDTGAICDFLRAPSSLLAHSEEGPFYLSDVPSTLVRSPFAWYGPYRLDLVKAPFGLVGYPLDWYRPSMTWWDPFHSFKPGRGLFWPGGVSFA